VTVDDLPARLSSRTDSTDAAFSSLERAFATALSLRRDCRLEFVAAPIPARDGHLLVRLQDRYSLVVHPYLDGEHGGAASEFQTPAERGAQVSMLAALHGAGPVALTQTDDFPVPHRDELTAALGQTGQQWAAGRYGERARNLLDAHAADLARLLETFDGLASRVADLPDRMVVTHGRDFEDLVTTGFGCSDPARPPRLGTPPRVHRRAHHLAAPGRLGLQRPRSPEDPRPGPGHEYAERQLIAFGARPARAG
jgi:hypothetical protein